MVSDLYRLEVSADQSVLDALSACLFEAGAAGLEERPGSLVVYASSQEQLKAFQAAVESFVTGLPPEEAAALSVTTRQVENNWEKAWQNALGAEQLTPSWVFRPMHAGPAPEGEHTIWFQPAQCFGAGEHPTTQLLARYLEQHLSCGDSLLDVGTGSGVLSLLAAKLGAGRLLAVDNDPESVAAARHNVSINGQQAVIDVQLGSSAPVSEKFRWVVANINTPVLCEILPSLAGATASGGTLLLAGLLAEDESQLIKSAAQLGLELLKRERQGEWSLLALQPLP